MENERPTDSQSEPVLDVNAHKAGLDTERFLAAVIESSDDAIMTKNLDGVITSWNKGAQRIFGYTASEAIGKLVLMLIPEDLQHEEPSILAKLRAGERIEHFETTRRCKDGSLLNVSLTVSPVRDASGKVIGASKIARDITMRRRGEEALRQRTKALEALNRLAKELSGQLDLEKLVQAVTDVGREISGAEFGAFFYNVKDPKGESYTLYTISGVPREAFSKFPMPRNTALFEPTFRGAGVTRISDVLQDPRYGKSPPHHGMPKGHLPVRSYLAVPVMSRTGAVIGGLFFGHSQPGIFTEDAEQTMVAIATQAAIAIDNANLYRDLQLELAAHKESEVALRESEGRFRAVIDNSLNPIWIKENDGNYVLINKRFEELFKVRERDVYGKKDSEIFPAEIARKFRENDLEIQRLGKPMEVEELAPQADGMHAYISTKFPLRKVDGTIYAIAGMATDITTRKKAEQELKNAKESLARTNEDLEKRVQERTTSLRELVAQMEEFSYSVSHDLRAPVRAMKGYAQAALEDYGEQIDARGRDYLDRIVRGGTRMERLIHDVLTYSRLARSDIQLHPVSLQALVSDVITQYPAMQPPHAEIVIRGPLHNVIAHEPSLTQAVSNLLSNGVKFVARDITPKIQVWSEPRPESGAIRLWIEDNGIGIRPEYQHKLFGMFERVHQEDHFDGTGIGLAIVRKAVEKMGGRVGVESDGLTGSSFWIELPAVKNQ